MHPDVLEGFAVFIQEKYPVPMDQVGSTAIYQQTLKATQRPTPSCRVENRSFEVAQDSNLYWQQAEEQSLSCYL